MTFSEIESTASSLLIRQKPRGEFALYFLDLRRVVAGKSIVVCTISDFEKLCGDRLNTHPEGCTLIKGEMTFVIYNELISSKKRINWTIAHELGHVFLGHSEDNIKEQAQADSFAAALLMPEAVVRFLDCRYGGRISPRDMTHYFAASHTACANRRAELELRPYIATDEGNRLVDMLFADCVELSSNELCGKWLDPDNIG